MGRLSCLGADTGSANGQRCSIRGAGWRATGTRLIGRVYASFAEMPMTMHHPNAMFPKGRTK